MDQVTLTHHGIKGMRWGVRRFQNPDGSLTEDGKKRYYNKLERQDERWARRNYNKAYNQAYKASKKEMTSFVKNELNPAYRDQIRAGKVGKRYINEYNRKLASVMNKNVSDLESPSGKVIRFVAKRGSVGVHVALADKAYDIETLRNGVYESGRVAYRQKSLDVMSNPRR